MAYKVVGTRGSIQGLTVRNFICDEFGDISSLPTNSKYGVKQDGDTVSDELCGIGSRATVASNGDIYILNASGRWVKKRSGSSGGSTGGSGSDIRIDNTLTRPGEAADAKAVGDALDKKIDLIDLEWNPIVVEE